jgi:sugar lactone lactonase YvrE
MGDLTVEQRTGPITVLGEGPVWHTSWSGLRWVDALAGDLLTLDDTTGGVHRTHVAKVLTAFRPRRRGGVVAAVDRGFLLLDDDLAVEHAYPEVWSDPAIRMNDGGCDSTGRFYCGSMAYSEEPEAGALYCLDPDGRTRQVLTGVTVSNGIAFPPDASHAYYVDSHSSRVDRLEQDETGAITDRRPVVLIEEGAGLPDGLTLDAEGGIWVGLWGGSQVRRYHPDGRLDAVVELPVTQVTACAFGGAQLDRLYITTAQKGIDPVEQPEAGSLFSCDPGVTGVPVLEFAG